MTVMRALQRSDKRFDMSALTEEERQAVLRGEPLPRRRPRVVQPDHANPGRGVDQRGLSREAVRLFEEAQRADGPLRLGAITGRRGWPSPFALGPVVDELVAVGLVERTEVRPPARRFEEELGGGSAPPDDTLAIRIVPGFEDAMVFHWGRGWSRWA